MRDKSKAKALDDVLDLITEDELPEYQDNLRKLVFAVEQDPDLADLTRHIGTKGLMLAFVFVDPRVKRKVAAMCRVAGVDRGVYYRSINNPKWVEFKNRLAKRFTEDLYADAVVALQQLIKTGDTKALRLFFELRGDLVQRSENINVNETPEERMKRIRAQEAARNQFGGAS